MKRKILITGGNSDIGISLINKIKIESQSEIISTRNSGRSIKELVSEEIQIDFSEPNLDMSGFDSLGITDVVVLHGKIVRDNIQTDCLNNSVVQTNLVSTSNLISCLIPGMIKSKFGRIVLVGSAGNERGGGRDSYSYGMSKSGLTYMARHLGKYYTEHNILSNCVSPGYIKTKFHINSKSRSEINSREETIPLGRAGLPEDVTDMIYYLLFINQYMTGQNVILDGGDFI